MNVQRVFSRNVARIESSALLEHAARLMKDCHVGALLVTEQGFPDRPVGIVTDRDLVVRALAHGVTACDCTVGEVMSPALASVSRSADVFEALENMRANGIRRLAVTEPDGAVVGIVSVDDIVGAIAAELKSLNCILASELRHEVAREGESGELTS
jgi:signal-transduction protein with cAMP-binding, CBS, and nucleotidyltransferase domain